MSDGFDGIYESTSDSVIEKLLRDRDGDQLPSMIGKDVCLALYSAGRGVKNGVAVEYGLWAGQSSRCLLGGMADADAPEGRYFGVDTFRESSGNLKKWSGTKWEDKIEVGTDFEFVWEYHALDIYPTAAAYKMSASRATPSLYLDQPVDVFSTDCGKFNLKSQLATVADNLRGGSMIFLLDFKHSYVVEQKALVYGYLVPEGFLKLAWTSRDSAGVAFEVLKRFSSKILDCSTSWKQMTIRQHAHVVLSHANETKAMCPSCRV